MTFTYTPGDTSSATRVRLLLGDTDPDAPLQQRLENEEITDLLTISGGYRAAAAAAADALAAKFARLASSKRMGQASLEWRRFEQLSSLAKTLRSSVSLAAVPFAGGISIAQRNTLDQDTDRVVPSFQKGMMDNPSTVNTTSTGV
jgi:hypothetical protein